MDGTASDYYYNGSVLIGIKVGIRVMRFSYDSSGSIMSVDYSSNNGSTFTTYYYLRNGQGDIVKLIDGSGNTVVQYSYDTWGKLIATTGSLATSLGQDQPFRYRGYVYDSETGWYYLQSRYYNPTLCRFISADVLLSTGQGVLGHDAYAYCLNNPVNMIDPSGCASKKAIVAALIYANLNGDAYQDTLSIMNTLNKNDSSLCDIVVSAITSSNTKTANFICDALTYLDDGIEYKLGVTDCSWFVNSVMRENGISGKDVYGGTKKMRETAKKNLGWRTFDDSAQSVAGDLLFWDSSDKGKKGHVAIYLGNGYIIDNSSPNGIQIRLIDEVNSIAHYSPPEYMRPQF